MGWTRSLSPLPGGSALALGGSLPVFDAWFVGLPDAEGFGSGGGSPLAPDVMEPGELAHVGR